MPIQEFLVTSLMYIVRPCFHFCWSSANIDRGEYSEIEIIPVLSSDNKASPHCERNQTNELLWQFSDAPSHPSRAKI